MSTLTLYKKNSQTITLPAVTDSSGSPITGATVTATLHFASGQVADTNISSLSMTENPSSSGNYVCDVDEAFDPPAGDGYYMIYSGTFAGGAKRFYTKQDVSVEDRVI